MRWVPRSWWSLVLTLVLASTVLLLSLVLSHHLFPGDSFAGRPAPAPASGPRPVGHTRLPLLFVAQPDPHAQRGHFQAHSVQGPSLTFTPAEVVLTLPLTSAHALPLTPTHVLTHTHLRKQFVGAHPAPQLHPEAPMPGVVHTFLGNDPAQWHTALPASQALRYEELYDGIDLRYTGTQTHLQATYVVAPGSDPTQIRWRYAHAPQVTLAAPTGDLIITPRLPHGSPPTPLTLTERAPSAWQTRDGIRAPVSVRYEVAADTTVRLEVGTYDASLPLMIAPTLEYPRFPAAWEHTAALALDPAGNTYVTGTWAMGSSITKLTPGGALVYQTLLGGSGHDQLTDLAVDAQETVYGIGETTSSTDFPLRQALQSTYGGGARDAFVVHLDATGQLRTSTYLGGRGAEAGHSIAVDTQTPAHLYVTGHTTSQDFPVTDASHWL